MSLVLTLSLPPSLNSAFANGGKARGRIKTKVAYQWETLAKGELMMQKRRLVDPPYEVEYALGEPKINRRRDCANYEKLLSDFLVKYNILTDDCQIRSLHIYWDKTVEPSTARLTITTIGKAE